MSAEKSGVVVRITVNAVAGADKYAVYRVAGGKTEFVGNTASGATVVNDTKNVLRNVSYFAVALDANGKIISDKGAAREITFAAAVKIKKLALDSNSVKINWKKSKGARKYIIYRSQKKHGNYKKVATVKKGRTSYTDQKVKRGKTYYYKVVVQTKTCVSLMGKASKKIKIK